MRRVIAGIDPGTTTGIALLSFYGDLMFLGSFRGVTAPEIERLILQHGKPVIIASDVSKPPKALERFSAQLGTLLFYPPRNLTQAEKDEIVRKYGVKVDDHARDALAAAYTAWKQAWPKIDKVLRKLKDPELVESVVERVLRGTQLVKSLEEQFKEQRRGKAKVKRERDSREVIELRRRISELREENEKLKKVIEKMRRRREITRGELLAKAEEKILSLRSEKERLLELLKEVERENEFLKSEVEHLKEKLEAIKRALDQGLVMGPPELVEGEEIMPGIVAGEPRKSPHEKFRDLVNEYRRKRRKELNLL